MELFNYLLKVSACSALFFAFYLIVLRKLTFFRFNRFYLLGSLLMSFIIPAMQFTVEREVAVQEVALKNLTVSESLNNYETILKTPITIESLQVSFTGNLNWITFLPYLYQSVVLILLLLAVWRVFTLLKHTKAVDKKINGLKLVVKGTGFTNCSFFSYVFIDENNLTNNELAVLLAHEEVHAKQYHSIDKLMLMIAKAFLWFNPIIYLYDKALEEVHEYEADETTSQNFGTQTYAALLLKLAVSKSTNPLIHNFVKSPIKQRIKMLFNSKSKNMKKLSYVLIFPLTMGLIWVLATEIVYANVERATEATPFSQNKPFIERSKSKDSKGWTSEHIKVNSPGKPLEVGVGFSSKIEPKPVKLWFYINDKLFTEHEALKFDAAFVKTLSTTKGSSSAGQYDLPIEKELTNLVFWFGKEPKLSDYAAKNRAVYQKYNGTTVSGTVVKYSYSANKNMDGFILKTNDGVLLKAFVEAKFVKQANAMIKEGEQVTIKIYNAGYWRDNSYPVLSSFKLMKGDKVLFDRWPKVAKSTLKTTNAQSEINQVGE